VTELGDHLVRVVVPGTFLELKAQPASSSSNTRLLWTLSATARDVRLMNSKIALIPPNDRDHRQSEPGNGIGNPSTAASWPVTSRNTNFVLVLDVFTAAL
jgi:hypothetical protein